MDSIRCVVNDNQEGLSTFYIVLYSVYRIVAMMPTKYIYKSCMIKKRISTEEATKKSEYAHFCIVAAIFLNEFN